MNESLQQILELLRQPVFLVSDGSVCWCNSVAHGLLDSPVARYLEDGGSLYSLWDRQNTLQTSLYIDGVFYEATVQATAEGDLFLATAQDKTNAGAAVAIQAAISLRRPLTALRTVAEEMFADPEGSHAPQLGCEMNRALYQLRRISEQMFDGGRLLLHRKQAQRRLTDLREFVLELVTQLRPIVESDGWLLETVLPGDALFGAVDRELLEQALFNLLSNALLHTRRGGKICVEVQRKDRFVLFHVDDNGEGISPGIYAEQSMDPRQGLGFGLRMVQEIARLHGGTFTIADKGPAGGTRASFSILPESKILEIRTPRFSVGRSTVAERGLVALSDALSREAYNTDDIQS